MQIVSIGDNLHEMSVSVFWGKNKKNVISLSSAELAKRVVKRLNVLQGCKRRPREDIDGAYTR